MKAWLIILLVVDDMDEDSLALHAPHAFPFHCSSLFVRSANSEKGYCFWGGVYEFGVFTNEVSCITTLARWEGGLND